MDTGGFHVGFMPFSGLDVMRDPGSAVVSTPEYNFWVCHPLGTVLELWNGRHVQYIEAKECKCSCNIRAKIVIK